MSIEPLVVAAILSAFGAIIPALEKLLRKATKGQVDKEKDRLTLEILGEPSSIPGPKTSDKPSSSAADRRLATEREESERFTRLLIDYYAYGLTQVRWSWTISLVMSTLGGVVLLTGVGLAVYNSNKGGDQYASVVASLSGLVTSMTGLLYHRQANRSLQHMEGQTRLLREDMKRERDIRRAISLLYEIADTKLRAQLQASLILQLSGAKLPKLKLRSLNPQSFNSVEYPDAVVHAQTDHQDAGHPKSSHEAAQGDGEVAEPQVAIDEAPLNSAAAVPSEGSNEPSPASQIF